MRGSATPGRARSNDMAGRSTALAQALPIALRKKVNPGDLTRGYSDLEMTSLLYC